MLENCKLLVTLVILMNKGFNDSKKTDLIAKIQDIACLQQSKNSGKQQ